jgi:hypothetical protein
MLDGKSLRIGNLVRVARDPRMEVRCDLLALQTVARGWAEIRYIVQEHGAALAHRPS